MAGTKEGAAKAAATNKVKYGSDFYRKIGKMGGSVHRPHSRAFVTIPGLAERAGAIGGRKSKRGQYQVKVKVN